MQQTIRGAILAAALLGATRAEAQNYEGRWMLDPPRRAGARDSMQLQLQQETRSGGYSNWGRTVAIADLRGLATNEMTGDGQPVRFKLVRDAGTLEMEGWFRQGRGSGHFTLALDSKFVTELQRRGYERPTSDEQVKLAFADAGYDLIDAMREMEHVRPSTTELVRLGTHGVNTKYVREMGKLGYRQGYPEQLRRLRDHGVTPEYVRAMADAGYRNLNWDELQRTRDHGVDARYIAEMKEVGVVDLELHELVKLRDHGVDADYIAEMRRDFPGASVSELRRARDHGVSPGYVRQLKRRGYGELTLERAIRIRDRGEP